MTWPQRSSTQVFYASFSLRVQRLYTSISLRDRMRMRWERYFSLFSSISSRKLLIVVSSITRPTHTDNAQYVDIEQQSILSLSLSPWFSIAFCSICVIFTSWCHANLAERGFERLMRSKKRKIAKSNGIVWFRCQNQLVMSMQMDGRCERTCCIKC